jgi:hypothetical protein
VKAHQRIIKEEKMVGIQCQSSFLDYPIDPEIKLSEVMQIDYKTASTIILEYEWIGTMPLPKSIRYMYGIYFDGVLGGAIVYVEPSTRQFFEKYPRQVVQLNRGATSHWTPRNTASRLIGKSLKYLREEGVKAIIAYCTKEAGEIGVIYQACNFTYVGETSPSKVYYLDKHWVSERTLADKTAWAKTKSQAWKDKFKNLQFKYLEGKYKYVLFIGNKREEKTFMDEYNYTSKEYPHRL